jgi:hypothetical protein
LVIAGFVIGAINMQLETIERAALLEAEHGAAVVAYAGTDNALNKPEYLQDARCHWDCVKDGRL